MKAAFLAFLSVGCLALADRSAFNDKIAPQTLDDLREIQSALQKNLERTRAATVCLQMGGGSGSAVIISEDGLVLTAAHVTSKVGAEITVVMEDGRKLKGRALGLNSETDSAMLQIEGEGPFPFVDVDLKDTTKLGDWVYSLGHSGGFDKERGINVRVGRLVRQADSTIQSDCMLIGGDSGGPLFNMNGQLVGIHSRVGASREESMHVPIREFQRCWDDLKKGEFIGNGSFAKKVVPGSGFLGLIAEKSEEGGLKVTEIWEEGPAEKAGLKVGDRILEVEGKEATDEVLKARLGEIAEGDKIKLKWISGEKTIEKEIELGARP
ncbi:MAG: trypsin-like peptidase domain-containing protein [Akkermansiaceae bacterium]|jgi:serine protease Do